MVVSKLPQVEITFYVFVWITSVLYSSYKVYQAGKCMYRTCCNLGDTECGNNYDYYCLSVGLLGLVFKHLVFDKNVVTAGFVKEGFYPLVG